MSIRLHTATRYDVQYSVSGDFANLSHIINPLLYRLCDYEWEDYIGDYPEEATEISINRVVYDAMLERLRDLPQADIEQLDKVGYEPQEVYDFLLKLKEQSDPDNDFIVLVWF
jgi:hypothetical protein